MAQSGAELLAGRDGTKKLQHIHSGHIKLALQQHVSRPSIK
jgi:hypothetical protein